MAAVPAKQKLTEAEYLAIELAAEFKSEFYQGEMFPLNWDPLTNIAGAAREHNTIKENLIGELFVRFRGGPCRTFSSDQRVRIDATGLYTYPDIVVLCGPGEYAPEQRDTLLNPTAVIEVLSPSTERYDRGAKFRQFQQLPSLNGVHPGVLRRDADRAVRPPAGRVVAADHVRRPGRGVRPGVGPGPGAARRRLPRRRTAAADAPLTRKASDADARLDAGRVRPVSPLPPGLVRRDRPCHEPRAAAEGVFRPRRAAGERPGAGTATWAACPEPIREMVAPPG